MSHLRALLVLWCLRLAVAPAAAQPVELPADVPVFASSLSEGETMIDAESVDQFSPIVLPALEHLVKRAAMPLPAIRELPFSDHRDLLWASQEESGSTSTPFPFPTVRDDSDADRALRIMRNGEAFWQNPPAFEAAMSYYRYRDGYEPNALHLNLIRSSTTQQQPYTAGQLFRELISFDMPPGILPLQFLTIRFGDTTSDRVWEHSGPSGVRSLEPWLRQERAAGGLFVLDDLFVHAASPAAYDYGEVLSAIQLVPFSGISQQQFTEDPNGCVTMTQDRQIPQFNTFSKRFARANGWTPTELVFVPRRVFVIKAFPKSPHPGEAESTIVVDRETMLPVMKVVRSDSGSLLRVVLGGMTLVRTKAGLVLPFVRQVVAITGGAREVDAISFDEVRRCGSDRAVALRSQLDTRALLKAVKEPESSGYNTDVKKEVLPSQKEMKSSRASTQSAASSEQSRRELKDEASVD